MHRCVKVQVGWVQGVQGCGDRCTLLLDLGAPFRCWKGRWCLWGGGMWGSTCSRAEKLLPTHPCPLRAALCPQEWRHSRPRTPTAPSPTASAALDNRAFIELCPRGSAGAPRSLLDPADGLDLARLRVGAPLPHVLVLARGAVALQEVLEAPVARVLRADPPATDREHRAALARGWRHRGAPAGQREGPGSCRSILGRAAGPGSCEPRVLTLRSGQGRSPRCCCPSPARAARGSRRSSLPVYPGNSPPQRASTCSARGPAAETGTALALPPCPWPALGSGGSWGGGTHGAGDGAEGAHPLHVVGVAAAPRLPARVLAALQHELLPLEAAVLEACPPAGAGGVRPPGVPTAPLPAGLCSLHPAAPRGGKRHWRPPSSTPPCCPWGPAAPWGGSAPGPPLTPRSRSCRSARC